jgi:uncharacterized protein (DUF885 family)
MVRWIAAPAALLFAFAAAAAEPPRNAALHAYFDRVFQEEMKENPELGTLLGVEGGNDKLADRSAAATARRKARVSARIAEISRFDPKKLNTQDRISHAMALDGLRRDARFNAFFGVLPLGNDDLDGWLIASPLQGVQDWFGYIAKATPTRNARDYEDYVKRVEGIPGALAQLTERMRIAARAGWTPPRSVMGGAAAQIDVFAKGDPADSPLYVPFKEFPHAMGEADRSRLAAAGRRAIAERAQPAFAAFSRYVSEEYIPATRESLGASALPGGPAYYAAAVEANTTTRLTPQEIHDIGLKEVARIRAEMEKVIASTGFKGSFAEFQAFLRGDPRFYFTKGEDMLKAYRDIGKRADAELPRFFAELPRLTYGIRPMDPHEGDNSDHYSRGALDGSRAGFFEANVNNLAKRPWYDMESTLLHETVPGHHLQIARSQELQGLPLFRRAGNYNAYAEGWALYSESLGYEMGFYKDPYMRFGTLSNEMLRACRLVIDTGVHSLGWTREQSIKYLADNIASHEAYAVAEVDRYIVWPGQALGYKVGELRIKAMRAKAEKELGPRFDIRRFHNALIDDGALPLSVLETRIDEWIARERAAKAKS